MKVNFVHSFKFIGIEKGGQVGPYLQSERLSIYKKYAEQLVQVFTRVSISYRMVLLIIVFVHQSPRIVIIAVIPALVLKFLWGMYSSELRREKSIQSV